MATVLVTGGNRGIGLELCRQYKERGDEVIAVCRRSSDALEQLGVRVESGIDVTSSDNIADLAKRLEGTQIDVLLNCAGILQRETIQDMRFEQIAQQFEVNAMGPLRVASGLLGHLTQGSKIGMVTSRMGSIADNTSGSRYGYRMSKAALNMGSVSLALDLKDQGISVAILHPGFVRTDMTGGNGLIDANESAQGLIARMDGLNLQNTGSFWHMNGEELPW